MEIKKYSYALLDHLSKKDKQYIQDAESLREFYNWAPQLDQFADLIEARKKYTAQRDLLADTLSKQYQKFETPENTLNLIQSLREENTFTIVTAHQPSLMTGPLYYVFKIASTVNLAKQLNQKYPSYKFIPIFITGGEDHDFEEINHINIYGKDLIWEAPDWEGGSVSELNPSSLEKTIESLIDILDSGSTSGKWLTDIIKPLIGKVSTYGEFARSLTYHLFRDQELLILSMDEPVLKQAFIPIIKEEIINQPSQKLVQDTQERLAAIGWKSQAHAREINFFYRMENKRIRIDFKDGKFGLIDHSKNWTKEEMLEEIENNPINFSPNVVMRPLFQEYILPNLAYIGGGGEISYWLERKNQFAHFNVSFPMLIRRNSALLVSKGMQKQMLKVGKPIETYFAPSDDLVKNYLAELDEESYDLQGLKSQLAEFCAPAIEKAKKADPTLEKLALAEISKMEKSIDLIESKIKKAIKKKEEVEINRLSKNQEKLFPGKGLQERKENIFQYLNEFGFELLDELCEVLDPMDKRFTIVSPSPD